MPTSTFQIKAFAAIVASMINHMKASNSQITDYSVGSVARTLVEAPAVEIDQLYQQLLNGIEQAIPVATYLSFNFSALPAVTTSGLIQVTAPVGTVIPAGTLFQSQNASSSYVSTGAAIVPIGGTVSVPTIAEGPGSVGNIGPGAIFTASPPISGATLITNVYSFVNGADAETEDQRLRRFQSYVNTLARGTDAAIIYGAKTTVLTDSSGNILEQVASGNLHYPRLPDPSALIAPIYLYIHNGVGGTSPTLLAACQEIVDGYADSSGNLVPGYRASGMTVNYNIATEVPLNCTATVYASDGYVSSTLAPLVESALYSYILSLGVGKNFSYSDAIQACLQVVGTASITFSTPTADQVATYSQKFMPGALTISGG